MSDEGINLDELEQAATNVNHALNDGGYAAGDTPWFVDPDQLLALIEAVRAAQGVMNSDGDDLDERADELRAALTPFLGSEAFVMQWKKRAEPEIEALRRERTEAFKTDLRPDQIAFAKECRRRIASAELLALDVERTLAAVLVPGAQYVTAEALELVGPGWTFTRHSHPGGGFTIGVELPPEGATTTGREVES